MVASMKCINCKYYGFEDVFISKTTYNALSDEMINSKFLERLVVCNIDSTSNLLDNRVNACSRFAGKGGTQ